MEQTNNNSSTFKKLSTFEGQELEINLDESFDASYDAFRKATSKIRKINDTDYRAVYLPSTTYGGLTINFENGQKLQLIMNLEFYYVYGFLIGDTAYGFEGEGAIGLKSQGFDVTLIPYGDSYTDIRAQSTAEGFPDVSTKRVKLSLLYKSMENIINPDISFKLKSNDILVTFWSLVEGIRFSRISNTIDDLLNNHPTTDIYDNFYQLAENWKNLSVAAADKSTYNPVLAVYELDSMDDDTFKHSA
jgi:hypothetical protein